MEKQKAELVQHNLSTESGEQHSAFLKSVLSDISKALDSKVVNDDYQSIIVAVNAMIENTHDQAEKIDALTLKLAEIQSDSSIDRIMASAYRRTLGFITQEIEGLLDDDSIPQEVKKRFYEISSIIPYDTFIGNVSIDDMALKAFIGEITSFLGCRYKSDFLLSQIEHSGSDVIKDIHEAFKQGDPIPVAAIALLLWTSGKKISKDSIGSKTMDMDTGRDIIDLSA